MKGSFRIFILVEKRRGVIYKKANLVWPVHGPLEHMVSKVIELWPLSLRTWISINIQSTLSVQV